VVNGVPGKLQFVDGNTGYLKMRAGSNIIGSGLVAKGQLVANSGGDFNDNTPMPRTGSGIIEFMGDGYITCYSLDVNLQATHPSSTYVETYGQVFNAVFAASTDIWTVSVAGTTAPPNGRPVFFTLGTSGVLPPEFSVNTTYYSVGASTSTCQLATTYGGPAITSASNSTGTIYMHSGKLDLVSVSGSTFRFLGQPPAAASTMMFRGSNLPGGLSELEPYFTYNIVGQTCQFLRQSANVSTLVTPTSSGSGSTYITFGHQGTTSKVMGVVQDVTTDPYWAVPSVSSVKIVLADIGPAAYDMQRDYINQLNAQTLLLQTNAVAAVKYGFARIYLVNRNVAVRSRSTVESIGGSIFNMPNSGTKLNCEISNISGWTSLNNGNATWYGSGMFMDGIVSGFSANIYYGARNTHRGISVGLLYPMAYNTYSTVSGTIVGCSAAAYGNISGVINGDIMGCTSVTYGGQGNIINGGSVRGCNFVIDTTTDDHLINIPVYGCAAIIDSATNCTATSPLISNCTNLITGGTNNTITGMFVGSNTILNAGTSNMAMGSGFTIYDGTYGGAYNILDVEISGFHFGSSTGGLHNSFYKPMKYGTTGIDTAGVGCTVYGDISNCTTGISASPTITVRNSKFTNVAIDINTSPHAKLYSVELSQTNVAGINYTTYPYIGGIPITVVNYNPQKEGVVQRGAVEYWTQAGSGVYTPYSAAAHSGIINCGWAAPYPSSVMTARFDTYVLPTTSQYGPLTVDLPLRAVDSNIIKCEAAVRVNDSGNWGQIPQIQLIDCARGWGQSGEILTSAIATEASGWQLLALTYPAVDDRQLALRVTGTRASRSGSFDWCWRQVLDYPVGTDVRTGISYGNTAYSGQLVAGGGVSKNTVIFSRRSV
jgi:hypothetical protein